jgi:hypothetical protein
MTSQHLQEHCAYCPWAPKHVSVRGAIRKSPKYSIYVYSMSSLVAAFMVTSSADSPGR